MKIRIATLKDLDSILRIYEHARSFMASHGNPTQWGTTYPPVDMIEHDIRMATPMSAKKTIALLLFFTMHLKMMSLIPQSTTGTG